MNEFIFNEIKPCSVVNRQFMISYVVLMLMENYPKVCYHNKLGG